MATRRTKTTSQAAAARCQPPSLTEPEAGFQKAILDLAKTMHWLWWHDNDSRRNERGFPDLVLVKAPRVLMLELKTARGRASKEQVIWLAALAQCPGIETALLRPSDWPRIEAALIYGAPLTADTER